LGFILTFSITGLVLSYLVTSLNIAPDILRNIAIVALGIFGVFMIWPTPFEKLTVYLSGYINKANQTATAAGTGNFGGFVLGIMLGVIWTPCAGPVLGSILTLIATSTELGRASILLIAYAIGAGLPMLIIAYGGQIVTTRVRSFAQYATRLQQIFGLLIISLAVAMYFQYDLLLQAKLLEFYDFGSLEQKLLK
jgi:cytochrome c biogenesis protein CcdA